MVHVQWSKINIYFNELLHEMIEKIARETVDLIIMD